jgi:hypothetical protein
MRSPGEGRAEEMPRHGAFTSGRSWLMTNLGASAVARSVAPGRSMVLRYEDFVARPRLACERALELLGEPTTGLPFQDEHTVRLGPNHTAGGNPVRLVDGATTIRPDDEWRRRQRAGDRLVSTTLALPILHRYGYPVLVRSGS